MDFLDPKKKRAHTVRLFIGYALVAIALLIGTSILVLEAYGFDLNRKTGTVIQNGLVFVDAHPDTADIYIDGINKGKTDNRLVIPEGDYKIELRRNGYRTWKNSFSLGGGMIERFIYPFMFPTKLNTVDKQQYATSPGMATESPDRHWLLIQQPAVFNNFDVFDLNDTKKSPAVISLPKDLLTASAGPQSLILTEWSTDNRHLIAKHNYTGGEEYILIDRDTPASSQNLSKLFTQPAMQFSLRDKKYDQYYLYDPVGQTLYSSDLKSKQITLQINKVVSFKPHGSDVILYVTDSNTPTSKPVVKVKSGQDTYTIRELAKSSAYLLDIARFDNNWYMAAGSVVDGRVYVYRNPIDQAKRHIAPVPVALLKEDNPKFISFSTNTRFLEVQSGSKFAVYDAENEHSLRYDIGLPIQPDNKATWMDGHRMLVSLDGSLRVFDFDGTNLQTLNSIDALHLPFFDRDYKTLFTIAKSATDPAKSSLTQTDLKVVSTDQSSQPNTGF